MKDDSVTVVATGGFSEVIAKEISCIDRVDKLLTLEGLRYLCQGADNRHAADAACLVKQSAMVLFCGFFQLVRVFAVQLLIRGNNRFTCV